MKSQRIVLFLALGIILRNFIPFVDAFLIVLTILLLTQREQMLAISYMAIFTALIYSFVADSPIGLFPLVLTLILFLFNQLFKKLIDLGIPPLFIGFLPVISVVVLESLAHIVLLTGRVVLLPTVWATIFWSCLVLTVTTFVISFKKKI